ncbi:hypothetical protein [Stenotrophomonas humi]|uniref:hypothetical protein n=1 Tax=Stenotrophomonas humi TaxID=405444 RepID=UPI00070DF325|nr:hypothetical protein [Stenotrophomonas humi]
MPAAAIVGVAVSAYAANQQKKAAKGAANATQRAADSATAEQARQYDQSRQDNMPWLQAGQNALSRLEGASAGNFDSFKASPDYQFTLDQGLKGLERGASARGGLYSGGADADRMQFGAGVASQQFGDWWNRQAGIANVGQTTASGLASLGQNYANAAGNNAFAAADARSSAYGQRAYANNALAGSIANTGLNALGKIGWGGV